jgi:tRNA(fMet)-specific endonuclease VapC
VAVKLVLDTSAYVGFKLGHPQLVDYLSQSDTIYLSPIVMGELLCGFRNGSRFQEDLADLNRFLSHEVVENITIGELTADRYSRIAAQLKQQGTPIPPNSIWIAAQTMEYGAELVTMDRHFEKIPGMVCTIFSPTSRN